MDRWNHFIWHMHANACYSGNDSVILRLLCVRFWWIFVYSSFSSIVSNISFLLPSFSCHFCAVLLFSYIFLRLERVAFRYCLSLLLHISRSPHFGLFFPSHPYNWRTPYSYLSTAIYLMLQFYSNNIVHFNCCCLFFGICEFIIAFTVDFRRCLLNLDGEICYFAMKHSNSTFQSRMQLKQMFYDVIKFHIEIKELSSVPPYSKFELRLNFSQFFIQIW